MVQTKRNGQMFAAEIGQQVVQLKNVTKRYWQESTIRFVEIMQHPKSQGGRMPVLYGFLRSSLMCSTSPIAVGTKARTIDAPVWLYFPNRIEDVIRSAKVGQTLYFGYEAEYWAAQEYGWEGNPGNGFIRMAVLQWPQITMAVESELRRQMP